MANVSTSYAIKKEGDFCISQYGEKISFIQFCPKLGTCAIEIKQKPAVHPIWQWDGNYEFPTIQPSIGCDSKCGKHVTITKGIAS